ncbi:MAG: DUF2125 domain-containing protein [Rhizobiaceae bacterium]|nr:DUF2125 domain-containing protein [Rhizobiaceae bacterium]
MSSSEAQRSKSSRKFVWLAMFIVLLFGGYSLGWYWMAGKARERVESFISHLNGNGRSAVCENSRVAGFPFRLGLACDSVVYQDERNRIAITAGGLRTAAQIYQPLKTVAELDGPLRIDAPGITPLFIEWDSLRASARLSRPLPSMVSLEATGLSGISDPSDETDPVSFFSAEQAEAHFRPNGSDLDWAGSFRKLEIDPEAVGNRTLPILDGEGDATVKNGVALVHTRPTSLRGQSIEIRNLAMSSGDAKMTLSGPIAIDTRGLVDASLKLAMHNPAAVSKLFETAVPERANEISQAFGALGMLGDTPSVPIKIEKSKIKLDLIFGSITLGQLPPLE